MGVSYSSNLLLAALPADDLARLKPLLRRVPLRRGSMLLDEGRPIERVYFPNGGICSLTMTMTDGRIAEVGLVGHEGIVGYLSAFGLDDSMHSAMMQVPDGTADTMSRRDFRAEIGRGGALACLLHRFLLASSAFTLTSIACNALHTAEERCARWLLHVHDRMGVAEFELSHEYIAMMLGVRRPTVTLVAGALRAAGLIKYSRGRMTILDRAGLEAVACECHESIEPYYTWLLPPVPRAV